VEIYLDNFVFDRICVNQLLLGYLKVDNLIFLIELFVPLGLTFLFDIIAIDHLIISDSLITQIKFSILMSN
jgi:hypothetical protein